MGKKVFIQGGSDCIINIQPLCRNCNSKKWKHIYEHPHLLNPAGGQPVSTNMQTDPNAKQEQTEPAQEAAAEATTDTGASEAGEATDTEAGGE